MKISKVMIAVAALAATSAALAAPNASRIIRLTGASATLANMQTALDNLCSAAGGVTSTFPSGSSIVTKTCANAPVAAGTAYASKANAQFINFDGTDFAEARINVVDGSFTALQGAAGTVTNFPFRNPASNADDDLNGSVGGLLDVEAAAFSSTATDAIPGLFDLLDAGTIAQEGVDVVQAFGVVVSAPLYELMFLRQKQDGLIPSTCALTDTSVLACVPSIGKAEMASIISANTDSPLKAVGAAYWNSTAKSANTAKDLVYARRVDTSGTQASAQVYFLNTQCSSASVGVIPQDNADYGKFAVESFGSTGTLRTRVNSSTDYVIGVMSGENDQSTLTNARYVRVNFAPMAENAALGSNTNTKFLLNGKYDFAFESKLVYDTSNESAAGFMSALKGALQGLSLPKGLAYIDAFDTTGTKMTFSRGGNSCTPASK
jgi:hypothetical protein